MSSLSSSELSRVGVKLEHCLNNETAYIYSRTEKCMYFGLPGVYPHSIDR